MRTRHTDLGSLIFVSGTFLILPHLTIQVDELRLETAPTNGTFSQLASISRSESLCSPNTFFCRKENSCVPFEWLVDGEPDCEGGEDETEEARVALVKFKNSRSGNHEAAIGTAKKDGKQQLSSGGRSPSPESPINSTLASSPIVAATSTASSATQRAAGTVSRPSEVGLVVCNQTHVNADKECSREVSSWLARLQSLHSSGTIFRHLPSVEVIHSGCKLISEYLACISSIPEKCRGEIAKSGELRDWLQGLHMYMCELVIPSVREHIGCFGALRRPDLCPPIALGSAPSNESGSIPCSLLAKARADIQCVEAHHGAECSEAAMELIAPMMSESEHMINELRCPHVAAGPRTPSPAELILDSVGESGQSGAPPGNTASSSANAITSSPQRVHPSSEASTTSRQKPPPSSSQPNESQEHQILNPLYALGHTDTATICPPEGGKPHPISSINDQFAPIRTKICAQKEQLTKAASCFQTASTRGGELACLEVALPAVNSSCEAIERFSRNVDCVDGVVEKVCPHAIHELVVDIREKLNDEAIAHRCYQPPSTSSSSASPRINDDGFALNPVHRRCDSDQESAALICLTELVEVNKRLAAFQSQNLLLELSDQNSTFVADVCGLYGKYENCLVTNVFARNPKKERCAFNSPLNTLARIGLTPMCSAKSRQVLLRSRECLLQVASQQQATCQYGLQNLGHIVNLMLQGIHGEALLCKTLYLLKDSFQCGEMAAKERCQLGIVEDLSQIKLQMLDIGREEGCPSEQPSNLDAIIAKPVRKPPPPPPRLKGAAPVARPAPPAEQTITTSQATPSGSLATVPCAPDEQKRFGECVQPLTAFQPHPLAVIKQPKQIDEACEAYSNFTICRAKVKCNPLWAQGMSAMFTYACGEGRGIYEEVKQCIRRTTAKPDVRDCVMTFSKGQPQEACQSSRQLLDCAIPAIGNCSSAAVNFAKTYLQRFAGAIDPACRLEGAEAPVKAINAFNCSSDDEQLVDHCSAPLNEIHARVDHLFEGGLQSFLKNMNELAPIFAQACNLTDEFRQCAKSVLEEPGSNGCVVSSCMIHAGEGICDQPDVPAAIEQNLGCVFKQMSNEKFGTCLRTTIGTLRHFTLRALKEVLPKFVECVEPIVLQTCGIVPINVLKTLGSKSVCPVTTSSATTQQPAQQKTVQPQTLSQATTQSQQVQQSTQSQQQQQVPVQQRPISTQSSPGAHLASKEAPKCSAELFELYDRCQQPFYAKFNFLPIALVNQTEISADEMCVDVRNLLTCWERSQVCEPSGKPKALRKLYSRICSTNKDAFNQRRDCLNHVALSPRGRSCRTGADLDEGKASIEATCEYVNRTTHCMAEDVFSECPAETLSFVFEFTNDYLKELSDGKCAQLHAPTIALNTGCSEEQLVEYLECEQNVDKYHFQPITIIGTEPSKWDEFCQVVKEEYRPCVEKLACRFEPATSAYLTLFSTVCEKEVAHRDQLRFAPCLSQYATSPTGHACLEQFGAVDMLTKTASSTICGVTNSMLACAAKELAEKCGDEALLHVYDVHNTWVHAFNSTCILTPPENLSAQETKPTEVVTSTEASSTVTHRHRHQHHHKHVAEGETTAATDQAPAVSSAEGADEAEDESETVESSTTRIVHGGNGNSTTGNGSARSAITIGTILMGWVVPLLFLWVKVH